MGRTAGARLYSAAVHVLAIVGVASLIGFGLHFVATANVRTSPAAQRDPATTAVRHDPTEALLMVAAPMRSRASNAAHPVVARSDGGRWRAGVKSGGTVAAPAPSDAPLLRLDPVDEVLNASAGQAGAPRGREESESAAPDAAPVQHGGDSGLGEGEGGRRVIAAQAANGPEADEAAAHPLLVLAAGREIRADQPLLRGFGDAVAASGAERSADAAAVASDAPPAHDQGPSDSGAAGATGGNSGELAPPDPGVKDSGAQ